MQRTLVNEAVVVDKPVEEEDSDFLDFEEEDLDGVPNEDDYEVDEELRDRGFEDIFKNKIEKYADKLGGDEEFISSLDEPSEFTEEELDVLAQPGIDLPSRRKSRKLRYDDSSAISFFELDGKISSVMLPQMP
ncbi:hypothetical protein HAX54_052611 [Datura stramonium]|uniref:Uncharacterized protein n=1 Tax=Datura stramonium TaxID=4076 RepID=A0ABS8SZX2_DATST|nr:hypothetical protein [Datura stramonium]